MNVHTSDAYLSALMYRIRKIILLHTITYYDYKCLFAGVDISHDKNF